MADIQLRFDKDMLVLSTPFSVTLNRLGFDESDRDYVILCESESVEEAFKFESMAQTPVFVLPTENLTDARLMHSRFDGRGATMVQNCLEALGSFNPQHVIAAIGPTGLPLDESSKSSLRQSFEQYKRAVLLLSEQEIDGIYFSGFDNGYDAQCALMGARAVYDGPLFCSFILDEEGRLSSGSHDLVSAALLARESGADVVGVVTGSEPSCLLPWVDEVAGAIDCPLLVELVVAHPDRRQAFPSKENPYPRTDHVVDAALQLRAHGVQFVRVQGNATPAYTGGLVAVLSGLDVHLPSAKGRGVSSGDVAEGFCAEGGVS